MKKILLSTASLFMILLFSGCANSVYYAGMEKVGFHKRDIMVDRVKNVQESQKEAQEEFKSALDQFGSLVKIKDNVLILKHSLNAQAIGALRGEFGTLKKEISVLISRMNQSIKASNTFIKEMK